MEIREENVGVGNIKSEFFHCKKCGEDLLFEKQADKLMEDIVNFKKEQHYVKTVSYSGNSLVLRIPSKLAKEMGIKSGSKMGISPISKGFVAELS